MINGLEAISVGAETAMTLGTTDTMLWVIDESPAVLSQLNVRLEKQARRKNTECLPGLSSSQALDSLVETGVWSLLYGRPREGVARSLCARVRLLASRRRMFSRTTHGSWLQVMLSYLRNVIRAKRVSNCYIQEKKN